MISMGEENLSGLWNEQLFQDFLANRLEIVKKPINTKRAVKSLRKKLIEWHNIGYNVDAILQHAIDVGWRGLFLPTGMEPKQRHLSTTRAISEATDSLLRSTRMPRAKNKYKQAEAAKKLGRDALEELRKITRGK